MPNHQNGLRGRDPFCVTVGLTGVKILNEVINKKDLIDIGSPGTKVLYIIEWSRQTHFNNLIDLFSYQEAHGLKTFRQADKPLLQGIAIQIEDGTILTDNQYLNRIWKAQVFEAGKTKQRRKCVYTQTPNPFNQEESKIIRQEIRKFNQTLLEQ